MRSRAARALRRLLLLLPLVLTALALLLLPRPPPMPLPVKRTHEFTSDSSDRPRPVDVFEDDQTSAVTQKEAEDSLAQQQLLSQRPWFMTGGKRRPTVHDNRSPLFPEDAPTEDRIVEQLMYKLPENEYVPLKTILLANGLSPWGAKNGRTEFLRNKCPVDKCFLTADRAKAAKADAILFKDVHTATHHVRHPNQIWILYYLECPYHTPQIKEWSYDMFNWTATYRRDSDIVAPYEKWVYHDPMITEKIQDKNFAANKTKKVAWFVSNCHAINRRLQYAQSLSEHIQVDIYGSCGTHRCPKDDPNCLKMLDKDYKFYLALENSNCRNYVTEKFFVNGLSHDILPIVMGARPAEYAAVAPPNSYLHVEEFANPQELAAYLHRLDMDDTLYNSYFKWKGTGEFINTYFFCRVCAMLHANDRRNRYYHYPNIHNWWRKNACTRTEWREEDARNMVQDTASLAGNLY